MTKDYFKNKAASYEKESRRVSNVDNIANLIVERLDLEKGMHLLDFGAGTGLLLERVAPYVEKITAVDISKAMIEQLEQKRDGLHCDLAILEVNLESSSIDQTFDGIISSMTMHHVQHIDAMFEKFYSMLDEGGVIGISDLDKEDGSFHGEDTGVFHFGFERDVIAESAIKAGFRDLKVEDASVISKPYGNFSVFLLTGRK